METAFYITYGGRGTCIHHVPYRAIAHTADEAIAIINTWKPYGMKSSPDFITVNEQTATKISNLFCNGLGTRYDGKPKTWVSMRTTGCGDWDITFYPALADTLEKHDQIYNERREANKKERIRLSEIAKKKRLMELSVPRRGWYHVELNLLVYVFSNFGNDFHHETTYCCTMIADSGIDAYNKVVKRVKEYPEEIMVHGNHTALETWADAVSKGFTFTFLGIKTDDGYSVAKWEEWHKNGEF